MVDVVYYESLEQVGAGGCSVNVGGAFRIGPAASLIDTYRAQSLDGGASFGAPVRVSDATTNWCAVASNIRPNMGDYIGSAAGANRILPAWTDGRNGVPDTFFSSGQTPGKKKK